MKLDKFLTDSINIPTINPELNFLYDKLSQFGSVKPLIDKIHNYYLGVYNALQVFKGDIDSDLCIIEKNEFQYDLKLDDTNTLECYISMPKNKKYIEDIDIEFVFVNKDDETAKLKDLLEQIADYASSCKEFAFSDNTKDFENIEDMAMNCLTLLNAKKL